MLKECATIVHLLMACGFRGSCTFQSPICKRLRSPRIYFKESIPPANVAKGLICKPFKEPRNRFPARWAGRQPYLTYTGPPGYIGWRNRFKTFTNTGSVWPLRQIGLLYRLARLGIDSWAYKGLRIRAQAGSLIVCIYYSNIPSSNGNASETKANESFDNGVFFDIEAKRTPSIVSKLFSKRSNTHSIERKLFSKRSEHVR